MAEKFIISAGDVIEVQLTSETVVIEGQRGQRSAEPGHITNRMRLFVREIDGAEKKYDFEDTELGVRETQRVCIVRGRPHRAPEPVNLILFNLSSGESDTFERGLSAFLGHRPFFGPIWKAALISIGVGIIFWAVSNYETRHGDGGTMSIFFAAMFAFLTYPIFWWLAKVWDRLTEKMRYKNARKRFIADMTARARVYAPVAASPAAAAQPAPPPPEPTE